MISAPTKLVLNIIRVLTFKNRMMGNFDYEQMEMPTPCQHCGEIFDLNDGYGSEKWHKNVVICEKCYREEEAEIEEDERWEGINIEISNALYHLKEEGAWGKLSDVNRALIIQIVMLPFPLSSAHEMWQMAREMTHNEFVNHYNMLTKGMQS